MLRRHDKLALGHQYQLYNEYMRLLHGRQKYIHVTSNLKLVYKAYLRSQLFQNIFTYFLSYAEALSY